jgi:ABC-type multidrug transport system fused ATPase/permease subunit
MEYTLNNLPSNKKEGIALLKRSFLKYKGELLVTIFFLVASAIGAASIPKLVEYAINTNIAQKDTSGLMTTSIIILCVALATTALIYFRTIFANTLSQKVLFNLRKSVFEKLQELPLAFYSDNQTGDIIQRITENVSGVDRFFTQGLMRLLDTVSLVVFSIVFMIFTNIKLTLISAVGIILIFAFLIIQGRILKARLDTALKLESRISSFVEESLEGHKTIASFDKEKPFFDDFNEVNKNYYDSIINAYKISSLPESVLSFISSAVLFLSLYLSLIMLSKGEILKGTVILFVSYTISIFRNLSGVSRMWTPFQNGISSAQRINQVLKLNTDITNDENPYNPDDQDIKGDIVFRNVEFSYGGRRKVLEDINFSVSAGKSVAIVGPTGAGKTTFVNLIARLYDLDKGSILFDGVDIKRWDLNKLRGQIGYLIQDTFLFEDTILNNLKYSNPLISKEDALRTFRELGAEKFIEELPDGLDTKLEAEGKNLSAGQRQIIALARVLLRKPKILILDEATSKIDTKSEKMIQNAIDIARKGNTSFIIAHRLSTIFNADLIVVIQENRILEQGSHDELIRKKGKYYEMYSKFVGN